MVEGAKARFGVRVRLVLRRLSWPASIAFCAVFPALVLVALFATAIQDEATAVDFRVFYAAAESMLHLETPYVLADDAAAVVDNSTYAYPPLTALGVAPFTLLPLEAAALLAMVFLILATLAIPLALGVRDWRCYGLTLVWPPVIAAVQTGSVTILLALGAALVWRFRDRLVSSSLCTGITIALKLILWPLLLWLVATRRAAAAMLASAITFALVVGSWAIIGFAGLMDYPELLRRLKELVEIDCYTVYVLALDAGASPSLARGLWLAVGIGALVAIVLVGRRGDQRSAFILAIAATLALSPIVWLHYFTLLLVVVSIAQQRLGAAWFAPLLMFIATGQGNPAPYQTAATIGAAALTVGLGLTSVNGVAIRSFAPSRLLRVVTG